MADGASMGRAGGPRHAKTSSSEVASLVDGLPSLVGRTWTAGNDVDVLCNGEEIFPRMLEAIDDAEFEICFVTFVWWGGDIANRFAASFASAAARGVDVTVVLDGVGSDDIPDDALERMSAAGVSVRWFHPKHPWWIRRIDHRTHRKILVVDRTRGFTGGVGIAEEWDGNGRRPGEWRDTHLEVRGPAVNELRTAYLHTLAAATRALPGAWTNRRASRGTTEPPGDGSGGSRFEHRDVSLMVAWSSAGAQAHEVGLAIEAVVESARRRLRIQTAYFMPRPELVTRLRERAAEGVEVQILLPGPHQDQGVVALANDQVLRQLVAAGAQIHTYQPSMMHAKIITCDGEVAVFGSANLNHRSFGRDEELVMVARSPALCATLDAQFDADLRRAHRVELGELRSRGWLRRCFSALARLLRREI